MKNTMGALVAAALLALPAIVHAQEAAPAAADEPGAETRAWLQLQTSNNAALGAARPMPGEVADAVFARYVKSFTHPIPETFNRDKFVEGGGSSQ